MKKRTSIAIISILLIAMLVNLFLSAYIEHQKNQAIKSIVEELETGKPSDDIDTCFRTVNGTTGSCATVQSGPYSLLFGISVGTIGILFFTGMSVLFALLLYFKVKNHHFLQTRRKLIRVIFTVMMVGGSLGAVRFIYLQFGVIKAICMYCMWIDSLLIVATILFLATWKRLV